MRVVFVAEQDDVVAVGSADEASYPAVDGVDPGGAPGVDGRVVEPDRGAVKARRRLVVAGLPAAGDDPDVLDRAPAQDPAEVQLSGCVLGGLPCLPRQSTRRGLRLAGRLALDEPFAVLAAPAVRGEHQHEQAVLF